MSSRPAQTENRWIPLECNPDVFNSWSTKAGLVPSDAHFEDVYGLEEELLAMVSKPVKAVILLFPDFKDMIALRRDEDVRLEREGQPTIDETVFWMKQTISNACGTMALIHSLANSRVKITPESALAKFLSQCKDKTPLERAKILEITPLFTSIHLESAESGQSDVPTDLDVDLHFTSFVEMPGAGGSGMRLIELDGDREGPIDRGESKNFLSDVANIVKKHYITQSSSVHFGMVAMCGSESD